MKIDVVDCGGDVVLKVNLRLVCRVRRILETYKDQDDTCCAHDLAGRNRH